MSTSYQNFAYVYDTFMDNIPYSEWSIYIHKLLKQYSISSGTIVELGCGTGTLCKLLSQYGYHLIGIDNSIDMLNIATQKTEHMHHITLLHQNMQELDLGNMLCDAFYCVCDSLNYLLDAEDIIATFQNVKRHLKTGGIFIFDLKTPYFYQYILGDQTFCDHQKDCSYTWENSYFEDDCINQYELTIFTRDKDSNLFERFTETHHQRAYTLPEIIDFLSLSGLEYVTSYDAFTSNEPHAESERIYIIARNGDTKNE